MNIIGKIIIGNKIGIQKINIKSIIKLIIIQQISSSLLILFYNFNLF